MAGLKEETLTHSHNLHHPKEKYKKPESTGKGGYVVDLGSQSTAEQMEEFPLAGKCAMLRVTSPVGLAGAFGLPSFGCAFWSENSAKHMRRARVPRRHVQVSHDTNLNLNQENGVAVECKRRGEPAVYPYV
eukprot:1319293-Amorphochlora_amoeboformis.AAC.1